MAFLLIFALSSMVAIAPSSMMMVVDASSKFSTTPAFHKKIEVSNDTVNNNLPFVAVSSLLKQRRNSRKSLSLRSLEQKKAFLLNYRGGADDDGSEDEVEAEVEADDSDDSEYDEESEEEEDYYDEEEEAEEDDKIIASVMKKSKGSETKFVDPYFISPSMQIYTTFGTILVSRKIDMFSPKVVKVIRFLFILQLVIQQAFIFYVRIMAKRANDTTPVETKNPLANMVESQLESAGGGNDMVKNLASSFLKKESTVRDYDIRQTTVMQGSILFNMVMMWFLHFKMQQVQPLFVSIVNGFMQLAYNPLFQVYIMGRNLERPFKSPEVFKPPTTEEKTKEEETPETAVTEDNEDDDEVAAVADEDGDDDDEDEDSSDEEMDDAQSEEDIEDSDEDDGDNDEDESEATK